MVENLSEVAQFGGAKAKKMKKWWLFHSFYVPLHRYSGSNRHDNYK